MHGPQHHYHPQEDGHEDWHEEEPQDMINTDRISVIRNLTDIHYEVGRLQGRPQACHQQDVGGAGHEHGRHGGAGHGGVIERKKRSARKRLKLELFRAR